MNPKIQQLAELADLYADEKTYSPGEYHPDWHQVRDQRFAELLVESIALHLENSTDRYRKEHFANLVRNYLS